MDTETLSPLRLVPFIVLGLLLTVFAITAPTAATRVDGGLYWIRAGGIADGPTFMVTHRDIACRDGDTLTTCTVTVGGETLTVTLEYPRPTDTPLACTADHGGRTVSCERMMEPGMGPDRAIVRDQLGVDGTEASAWQARFPWWMTWDEGRWLSALWWLVIGFTVFAGVVTWLSAGRERPTLPNRRRRWLAGVTIEPWIDVFGRRLGTAAAAMAITFAAGMTIGMIALLDAGFID